MHNEINIPIKEELTDEMFLDPTSMFLDDPLGVNWSTDHINEDSKLNFGWDENENNNAVVNTLLHTILEAESECCPPLLMLPKKEQFPDEALGISCPTDFIKEDPELNLEDDEPETIVVASTSSASNTMRLIVNREESCDISYDETVNQGLLNSKLGIDSQESALFAMYAEEEEEEEEEAEQGYSFGTRLKCSLRENKCHKFNCSFCLRSFPSKYRLIMHVFVHIDGVHPPAFVCKSCGEVFPTHDSLYKHLKISEVDQDLSAEKSEKFDFSGGYISTFLEGDQEGSVIEQTESQCSSKQTAKVSEIQCNHTSNTHTVTSNAEIRDRHGNDGTSNTSGNVNAHTVLLPAKRRQKCVVSGEYFTAMGVLKRNAIKHTGARTPKCDICGKSFTRFGSLKNHVLIHTGTKPHNCNICGKSFTRLEHLQMHSLIHTGSRPHKCDICGKSFTQAGALKIHALTHTGRRPHKCNICGKSFTGLGSVKMHVLLHTGTKPHKCNICGKSFTQLGNLKTHGLQHTRTKSHKCNICGETFTRLGYLKSHALTHTGVRLHKCDICLKHFTQLGILKRHMLIHTGIKPHKCNICGKSFTQLGNLKAHGLQHTGTKPHKCNICGKSFTEKCTLKAHTVIHTRPSHKCDICGRSFTRMNTLQKHLPIHTANKPH